MRVSADRVLHIAGGRRREALGQPIQRDQRDSLLLNIRVSAIEAFPGRHDHERQEQSIESAQHSKSEPRHFMILLQRSERHQDEHDVEPKDTESGKNNRHGDNLFHSRQIEQEIHRASPFVGFYPTRKVHAVEDASKNAMGYRKTSGETWKCSASRLMLVLLRPRLPLRISDATPLEPISAARPASFIPRASINSRN